MKKNGDIEYNLLVFVVAAIILILIAPLIKFESGFSVRNQGRNGAGYDDTGINIVEKIIGGASERAKQYSGGTQALLAGLFAESQDWGGQIIPLAASSVAAGDFNNDSRIDLVMTGSTGTGRGKLLTYTNNGTAFVQNSTWNQSATGIYNGSIALSDFNNDGMLDLIAVGQTSNTQASARVYLNNKATFAYSPMFSSGLVAAQYTSISAGDVDNDGKADVVIAGRDNNGQLKARVYRNTGLSLVQNLTLAGDLATGGVQYGSISLAELNGDGMLDLILSGERANAGVTNIYLNNGTGFALSSAWMSSLINSKARYSSLVLGNLNGDNKLDLFLSGEVTVPSRKLISEVHVGASNGFTGPFSADLMAVKDGNAVLGDVNNDGKLDVGLFGLNNTLHHHIYINKLTGFQSNSSFNQSLVGLTDGSAVFADVDNDLDLDYVVTGLGAGDIKYGKVYMNVNNVLNTKPSAPAIFNSAYQNGALNLSWSGASDRETTNNELYYDLRVGTCSGCNDIVSGAYGGSSNPVQGYFGNMMQRREALLKVPLQKYYWAVRSIDNGLLASYWSAERVFDPVSISVGMSSAMINGIAWNITILPVIDKDASGNNIDSETYYNLSIQSNVNVDVYINASGDLSNGFDIIPLANEKYTYSLSDPKVSSSSKNILSTGPILVTGDISGGSNVYLKFYLDVGGGQPPGQYTNKLDFIVVKYGQIP